MQQQDLSKSGQNLGAEPRLCMWTVLDLIQAISHMELEKTSASNSGEPLLIRADCLKLGGSMATSSVSKPSVVGRSINKKRNMSFPHPWRTDICDPRSCQVIP